MTNPRQTSFSVTKKLETLPLIRTKTKKSTLTTIVQHSLEVLVMAIREEKERKKKKVESSLEKEPREEK